jgi:hypothetical protein
MGNHFFKTEKEKKMDSMAKRLGAEFFGTFWLVLGGCGSAVLAAAFPNVGIGLLGVGDSPPMVTGNIRRVDILLPTA